MSKKPLVGVTCDTTEIGIHPFHMAGEKYILGVLEAADCLPFLIPSLHPKLDLQDVLDRLDGLLVTGAVSNIQPSLYGQDPIPGSEDDGRDIKRDASMVPLIPMAVKRGLPTFAICRGFQEMNIAYGGTLYQRVHAVNGRFDHRRDPNRSPHDQYEVAHDVLLTPGGQLHEMIGQDKIAVNSLHEQGIAKLGEGLTVEAAASDGQVEAIRVKDAKAMALGVQWHPEWRVAEHPQYQPLFTAFGQACRDYREAMKRD